MAVQSISFFFLGGGGTEHVESTATGHQRAESVMNRTLYLKHRREKLKNQQEIPTPPTQTSSSGSDKSSSNMQLSSSSSSTIKADEPPKKKKLVMTGVRVYINGYLSDTTDIEMKRTVTLAGGQVLLVPFPPLTCPAIPTNATQPDTVQRNTHSDVTRPERLKDAQAPNQELEDQSAYCETRMGGRQHQRRKEVARTALYGSHQPHDRFCLEDVRRTAL